MKESHFAVSYFCKEHLLLSTSVSLSQNKHYGDEGIFP